MNSRPTAVAVLASGGGSNLQAIIDACRAEQMDVAVRVVLTNNAQAGALARARRAGIATETVPHRGHPDRASFDRAVAAALDPYRPDLLVLAGFMRILGEEFVRRYEGRILNIHPSLLPAYPGLHTHERVIAAGDRWHGATVHFVTAELDAGPPIVQARVPVRDDDTAELLAQRVLAMEHRIYPQAIRLIAAGSIVYRDAKVYYDGAPLDAPLVVEDQGPGTT